MDESEFVVVFVGGRHILYFAAEVALFQDFIDAVEEWTENSDDSVAGPPVGGPAVKEADVIAAFAETIVNIVALEFEDDRVIRCVGTVENKGDHSTVGHMSVQMNSVALFRFVYGFVVDFVFGVGRVRRVRAEFGPEIGVQIYAAAVRESLEDFRE